MERRMHAISYALREKFVRTAGFAALLKQWGKCDKLVS
jgi:hypothetical protein